LGAGFIGRSRALPGVWQKAAGRAGVPGGGSWPAVAPGDLADGAPVDVVVRPEALSFVGAREGGAAEGRVDEVRFAGRETYFSVQVAEGIEVEVLAAPDAAQPGWKVFVAPLPSGPAPRAYPR
jgi:ABC-type Fe3+/spermidine/putrescine transport system ATPase subunit